MTTPHPWQTRDDLNHALEDRRAEITAWRAAAARALAPLLRAYADGPGLPEAFDATVVEATGFKGGNHSHGGVLSLRFATAEGANAIRMFHDDEGDQEVVVLTARGDWEQGGLVEALAGLLADLLPVYGPRS